MSSALIIAAEASSSFFAQRLLEYWKSHPEQGPESFFGVGSDAMEKLGFERLGRSEDMAVMGIAEVIEHYGHLKSVFESLVSEAASRRPSVAILMDYPDFNLRLAAQLKKLNIPVVYYITPQIWAWRKGRAQKIKAYCDQVFVLFPFEKKFFENLGVPAQFVGHPLLDEMDDKYFSVERQNTQRQKMGVNPDDILIGLMPGSRRGEIRHHMGIQLEVARRLVLKDPRIKIVILCAPTVQKEMLESYLEDVRFPYMLIKNEPLEMISLVDLMLAASGTATLQVGLLQKPMVVMYRFKWLTGIIAKLFVRGVKFFCIVNLIFDKEIVPERWQEKANPDHLFELMSRYLSEPEYYKRVHQELGDLKMKLGDRGATARVAQNLEKYFHA